MFASFHLVTQCRHAVYIHFRGLSVDCDHIALCVSIRNVYRVLHIVLCKVQLPESHYNRICPRSVLSGKDCDRQCLFICSFWNSVGACFSTKEKVELFSLFLDSNLSIFCCGFCIWLVSHAPLFHCPHLENSICIRIG